MKRILCLIDGLGSGGAERQMVGLATMLKENGYQVDLATYHPEKDFYIPDARRGGIDPVFLPVKESRWSKFIVTRSFIKRKGGYDCVITYKTGPNAIGCLLKLTGLRFKLIVSERIADSTIGNKGWLFKLYRFADYVVPNSYAQGEFLSKHFRWMAQKIVPITNFTDTEHFKPKESIVNDQFMVLSVARVAKQKNVLRYLDAIKLLKERGIEGMHCLWFGNVERAQDDYAQECYNKVKELGLQNEIEFNPATHDILKHYQQCDLFCLPSLFEGFPNVLCEAMSCGKPVVCGRVCDNERIVSDGENGLLFNPNRVEEIADSIQKMITMPREQLKQWGEKSRALAVELFSKKVFVGKYIRLIEG